MLRCGGAASILMSGRASPQYRQTPRAAGVRRSHRGQLMTSELKVFSLSEAYYGRPRDYNTKSPAARWTRSLARVLAYQLMKIREFLTRRNIIIASSIIGVALAAALFLALRRPPRVSMERYVPAGALAVLEVNNLADCFDGLTATKAWRELAPELGLSSQLRQIGLAADLVGRTGLGPDEAVVAGRAQYVLVLTGLEMLSGETDAGPYLHFKPKLCLIVETHIKPEAATLLVNERAPLIAQRIYGESVIDRSDRHYDTPLHIYRGPQSERPFAAACSGSLALVANDVDSIKSCLDTIAGRAPSLVDDPGLIQGHQAIDRESALFGFVTVSGINRLTELAPLLFANNTRAEPEVVDSIVDLVRHLSSQTIVGLFYGAGFSGDGVVESYLVGLKPDAADALAGALKPATTKKFETPSMIPSDAAGVTLVAFDAEGELPDRALRALSPHVDVVGGLALGEVGVAFRKQYALQPSESLSGVIDDEIAIVDFGQGPKALLVKVRDRSRLQSVITRYLSRDGSALLSEEHSGVELQVAATDEGRAAAFVDDFVAIGTEDQIARIIDARSSGKTLGADALFNGALAFHPGTAPVMSYRVSAADAGELILAFSKLTRVTDGSREILERDSVRAALDRLPRQTSFTEMRSAGFYSETHSAVGGFRILTSLIGLGD
jgi:hypothetical protein